jgi:hypothetical protein
MEVNIHAKHNPEDCFDLLGPDGNYFYMASSSSLVCNIWDLSNSLSLNEAWPEKTEDGKHAT